MGVRARMLVLTGRQLGVLTGRPLPAATSRATPGQFCVSMRTDTLLFWSSTRSGAGLPAAADWAHVGRPVVPPRSGSQQAHVVARMRVPSLDVAITSTVWLPVLGSFGRRKR